MKNLIIDLAEGAIFGLLFVVMLRIMGIETTPTQLGILVGVSIFAVSILNSIGMHLKGQGVAKVGETAASPLAVNRTWTYKYGENTIVIKNTASLCELIVNGQVQDTIKGAFALKPRLAGNLPGGEEISATFKATQNIWAVRVGSVDLREVSA